jgi:hypothetical protein
LHALLEGEAGQGCLVCPPGGFPGGSHLLAASRPDPILPPPPGKPSASSCWSSAKRRVHVSGDAGRCGVPGNGKLLRFCQEWRWRACANPQAVLLVVFSRPLSRCFPLVYCPLVLGLWWTEETSSTRWTLCLPPLNLQTRLGEEARKGRGAGGDHVHLPALSAFRTSSCLGRRNRTCPVTLLAVHAASGHEALCGGSFHERPHTRLQLYGAVPSAPPHAAPRSASGKQEDRLLAALALAAAA